MIVTLIIGLMMSLNENLFNRDDDVVISSFVWKVLWQLKLFFLLCFEWGALEDEVIHLLCSVVD